MAPPRAAGRGVVDARLCGAREGIACKNAQIRASQREVRRIEQEDERGKETSIFASLGARFYPTPLIMLLLLRFLIRAYQWTLSPLLSWLGGPGSGCRFHPTCSKYFLEAVERHGVLRGSWLGVKRLARCHPWGGLGEDPVPEIETLHAPGSTFNAR